MNPFSGKFAVWTNAEIQKFEDCWAVGTKQRLVFGLALYAGLRCSELLNLGPEDLHDDFLSVDRGKGLHKSWIPIVAALKAILDATPLGKVKIITTDNGRPMTPALLGVCFREACVRAGVAKRVLGLRRTFAMSLWEAGATEAEICALLGYRKNLSAHCLEVAFNHKKLRLLLEVLWKKRADDLRRDDRSKDDDDDLPPAGQ